MTRVLSVIHRREWSDSRLLDHIEAAGFEVEFVCAREGDELPDPEAFAAVMVGGGDVSIWRAPDHPWMADEIALARRCVERHVPYLGVCLGAQILAAAFGSSTRERPDEACEFGYYPLDVAPAGAELFDGVEAVYQAHSEGIDLLPADAVLLARTELFEAQAFSIGSTALGVQFHPDARGRDIARWWSDNRHLDGRPHAHDLERQLADAERFEESMSTMSKNLVDNWLVQR